MYIFMDLYIYNFAPHPLVHVALKFTDCYLDIVVDIPVGAIAPGSSSIFFNAECQVQIEMDSVGPNVWHERTPTVHFEDEDGSVSSSCSTAQESSLSASGWSVVHRDLASEEAVLAALRQEWMNGLVLELAMRLTDPQAAEAVAAVMGLEDKAFTDSFSHPASMFFQYEPSSIESCVGQMTQLWPDRDASHLQGCHFLATPQLPPGIMLDEKSGLVFGRAHEPTPPGQGSHFIVACNPSGFPMTVRLALVKLKIKCATDIEACCNMP